jgi:hypothetical protein
LPSRCKDLSSNSSIEREREREREGDRKKEGGKEGEGGRGRERESKEEGGGIERSGCHRCKNLETIIKFYYFRLWALNAEPHTC